MTKFEAAVGRAWRAFRIVERERDRAMRSNNPDFAALAQASYSRWLDMISEKMAAIFLARGNTGEITDKNQWKWNLAINDAMRDYMDEIAKTANID